MNILLYNYLQPEGGAGGVGVYSTNLARSLKAAGHRVITLSSGDAYSFTSRKPWLKTWRDQFERAVIINSPMLAPSYDAWDDFGAYTTNTELDAFPALLHRKYGGIDVFHFQNLEGLTDSFFKRLKAEFPASRFIYTAHNYSAVCPQVDLWFQDREICVDYRNGLNCTKCTPPRDSTEQLRSGRRRRYVVTLANRHAPRLVMAKRGLMARLRNRPLASADTFKDAEDGGPRNAFDQADSDGPIFAFKKTDGDGVPYAKFRQANIDICANIFDFVLAVSERTKQVILARGMRPDNIAVSYVGTAHKANFERAVKITSIGEQLHIAYLGYMRRSKGFYLLLQALELLPDDVARNIQLTVAAKRSEDMTAYKRLTEIASRFAAFNYYDGFTHKTLDAVLTGVNLGIVPPVWEDNLPQVAIEMVSRGIPVLTSDRGGAQEIADNQKFVFKGGSAASLQQHLQAFSTKEVALSHFWDGPIRMFSMEEHIEDLMQYYRHVELSVSQRRN